MVPPDSEFGLIAPKVFGDLLESLAGAVFLDSGLDLMKVWQVFYPIMSDTIGKYDHVTTSYIDILQIFFRETSSRRHNNVQMTSF